MKKMIWLSIMILILGLGINGQSVERKYDRFKDETNISIILGKTPLDANSNSLSLTLSSIFSGQTAPADPAIFMSLLVSSQDWKLLRADLTMRAIVDGERITIGTFKRDYSEVYRGATIEGATMPVTIATLRKLVAGEKVEFQFMGSETQVSHAESDRIKVFLDALSK